MRGRKLSFYFHFLCNNKNLISIFHIKISVRVNELLDIDSICGICHRQIIFSLCCTCENHLGLYFSKHEILSKYYTDGTQDKFSMSIWHLRHKCRSFSVVQRQVTKKSSFYEETFTKWCHTFNVVFRICWRKLYYGRIQKCASVV